MDNLRPKAGDLLRASPGLAEDNQLDETRALETQKGTSFSG